VTANRIAAGSSRFGTQPRLVQTRRARYLICGRLNAGRDWSRGPAGRSGMLDLPLSHGRRRPNAARPAARLAVPVLMESDLVQVSEQVLLADYTTLRLGGPAGRFVAVTSPDELVSVVRAADAEGEPVLVLGGGSNLVMADAGFPGTVVHVASTGMQVAADGDAVELTVAAGENWDELVQRCVADGLSGIECLSGIPGLAGATPIQNVNAYGQDVAHTISAVAVYDRLLDAEALFTPAECGFGYRTSTFKQRAGGGRGAELNPAAATGRHVVLSVTFALTADAMSAPVRYAELARLLGVAEGDRVPLAEARAAVLQLRRGKGMVLDADDPDTRSAGSFFTNPVLPASQFADLAARAGTRIPHWPDEQGQVKVSAAWLIEHAGFSRGFPGSDAGARISTKHTLALTSPGGGTTAELMSLARQVRGGVLDVFGVPLVNEPVLVGASL
jgi:UDP-N-acetylmuramate dehydrogenase